MKGGDESQLKSTRKTAQLGPDFAWCYWLTKCLVRKEEPGPGASRPMSTF